MPLRSGKDFHAAEHKIHSLQAGPKLPSEATSKAGATRVPKRPLTRSEPDWEPEVACGPSPKKPWRGEVCKLVEDDAVIEKFPRTTQSQTGSQAIAQANARMLVTKPQVFALPVRPDRIPTIVEDARSDRRNECTRLAVNVISEEGQLQFNKEALSRWDRREIDGSSIERPIIIAEHGNGFQSTQRRLGQRDALSEIAHKALRSVERREPTRFTATYCHGRLHAQPSNAATLSSVMFTFQEAKAFLLQPEHGGGSSHPPYDLSTGEYIPYPVTRSYSLGGMGRYSLIPQTSTTNNGDTDVGEYTFDWGAHYGKSLSEVPPVYIASILASPRLSAMLAEHHGLREALQHNKPDDPRLRKALQPMQPSSLLPRSKLTISRSWTTQEDERPLVDPFPSDVHEKDIKESMDGCAETPTLASCVHPKDYVLNFGRYASRPLHKVPLAYLCMLDSNAHALNAHTGLQQGNVFPLP
ncbi:hypothetical protein EK21DRAFT_118984 [Setomelanomma holmii]|uniref:Uncharacterized protein n=1 Tax=Setomelanomma holmii TaxID=210430 RepID=A0A9P4GUZ8_9PLEO|nr:hypothetical protein EK21DRAFT_118984 [Setomelanomma holmii]